MKTAKIFQHGGSQAVRLPKQFRFSGSEVQIEKSGEEVTLKPIRAPHFESFAEVAAYLEERFPDADADSFPEPPERPAEHERPILEI